nr:winged helix-turn-helix domain-containing protein [Sphingopyxis lutea]
MRQAEGPSGAATGEPRVVQVLVALADAKGAVLSREDLLQICWEGRIVGDDAINRAVAEVRKILLATGANFEVETIPRVGYRINSVDWQSQIVGKAQASGKTVSRRNLIVGGIAATVLVAGGSAGLIYRNRQVEINRLIERGRVLRSSGIPDGQKQAEVVFRQAIALDPQRADAWGWLAVVLPDPVAEREAAQRALALDPREPNARTVIAYLQRDLDDWTKWEDALLGVLNDAPNSAVALDHVTLFYQGMGRCKDSLLANERVIKVEPFEPSHQARRALKYWIFGNVGDADKVANRALELWPHDPSVWNARMLIYACTNRAPAALALLDDKAVRPSDLKSPSIESWHAGLEAIASRTPQAIASAVEICTQTASLAPGLAANAIMLFSYLGELDAAYRVAEGLFEGRGTAVQQMRGAGINDIYSAPDWARTQFLFIPATDAFREDSRFPDLCQRLGHVAYWRRRGIWPDPFVRGALDPAKLG